MLLRLATADLANNSNSEWHRVAVDSASNNSNNKGLQGSVDLNKGSVGNNSKDMADSNNKDLAADAAVAVASVPEAPRKM